MKRENNPESQARPDLGSYSPQEALFLGRISLTFCLERRPWTHDWAAGQLGWGYPKLPVPWDLDCLGESRPQGYREIFPPPLARNSVQWRNSWESSWRQRQMLDLKVMDGRLCPVRWLGCASGRKQEGFDLLWTHATFTMAILMWPPSQKGGLWLLQIHVLLWAVGGDSQCRAPYHLLTLPILPSTQRLNCDCPCPGCWS